MDVVEGTEAHLDAMVELIYENFEYHKQFDKRVILNDDLKISIREYFGKRIALDNSKFYLAKENDLFVGIIGVKVYNLLPINGSAKVGYVEDLYVKPQYRGRKIATALNNAANIYFTSNMVEEVSLNVMKANLDAIGFYEKMGFKTISYKMIREL
jgi:ribosomal protein S18 acetylase RimI-like enzyme